MLGLNVFTGFEQQGEKLKDTREELKQEGATFGEAQSGREEALRQKGGCIDIWR